MEDLINELLASESLIERMAGEELLAEVRRERRWAETLRQIEECQP